MALQWYSDEASARQRRRAAYSAVLTNTDLVGSILRGGIGPSTWGVVGQVCRAWREVCNSDEVALRMVALYQGGLTKGVFCGLFAFSPTEAASFAHTTHRSSRGHVYYLYRAAAVDAALALGGMAGLVERRKRKRVAPRSPIGRVTRVVVASPPRKRLQLAPWETEDRFHARLQGRD
jgi:hypothetical protein